MSFEEKNNQWDRIPKWNGSPDTWLEYEKAVMWYKVTEKMRDVDYSVAGRMVLRLTGVARAQAELLGPAALEPIRPSPAIPFKPAVWEGEGDMRIWPCQSLPSFLSHPPIP